MRWLIGLCTTGLKKRGMHRHQVPEQQGMKAPPLMLQDEKGHLEKKLYIDPGCQWVLDGFCRSERSTLKASPCMLSVFYLYPAVSCTVISEIFVINFNTVYAIRYHSADWTH